MEATEAAARAYAAELAPLIGVERRVCTLLAKGLTHKECADALNMSLSTVGLHLGTAKNKTGMTFIEIVVAMAKAGWV
jgi:DNA-binding CsgD family transcriptional regulator